MAAEKTEVLLIGPPKPVIVNGLAPAFNLHQVRRRQGPRAVLRRDRAAPARHRDVGHLGAHRRRLHGALPAARDRLVVRRRLRPYRRRLGRRARHHRHQHAGRAHRGGRRHRARAAAVHRARVPAGRALPARRQVGAEGLSAQQGDAAQPHGRAWSAWAASARRSRAGSRPCRCRWSITRDGRRRACPTGTIPSSSTWRATSTCCWSSRRAARRPGT